MRWISLHSCHRCCESSFTQMLHDVSLHCAPKSLGFFLKVLCQGLARVPLTEAACGGRSPCGPRAQNTPTDLSAARRSATMVSPPASWHLSQPTRWSTAAARALSFSPRCVRDLYGMPVLVVYCCAVLVVVLKGPNSGPALTEHLIVAQSRTTQSLCSISSCLKAF